MHNPSEIDFFLHFCIHTFAEHTQDHTFDTKERISGVWGVMENTRRSPRHDSGLIPDSCMGRRGYGCTTLVVVPRLFARDDK